MKQPDWQTTLTPVCQCMYFQVYFVPPFRPMGERATSNITLFMAPPKAQHPQPLRLKNYWRRQIWRELDQPATEGASNASCNLSGTKDRWGAARIRAAPFFILVATSLKVSLH